MLTYSGQLKLRTACLLPNNARNNYSYDQLPEWKIKASFTSHVFVAVSNGICIITGHKTQKEQVCYFCVLFIEISAAAFTIGKQI